MKKNEPDTPPAVALRAGPAVLTKAEAIRILEEIASAADATPARTAIARRMAQVFRGVPGATMPTDAEIAAMDPDDDDEDGDWT